MEPPITPDQIQPTATAAPAAEEEGGADIPDEVLAIPAMGGLLQGNPPAVFSPDGVKDPVIDVVLKNAKPLMEVGFGFYQTKDGKTNVLFNTQFVSEAEIKKADADGTLLGKVAVPLQELTSSYASAAAPTTAAPTTSAPMPMGSPGAVDPRLATARRQALLPTAPTEGSAPGRGRVLNSIIAPVV